MRKLNIILKFDKGLGRSPAETLVECPKHWKILNLNLAASKTSRPSALWIQLFATEKDVRISIIAVAYCDPKGLLIWCQNISNIIHIYGSPIWIISYENCSLAATVVHVIITMDIPFSKTCSAITCSEYVNADQTTPSKMADEISVDLVAFHELPSIADKRIINYNPINSVTSFTRDLGVIHFAFTMRKLVGTPGMKTTRLD